MEYSPPPLFKQGAPARVKVTVFALIAIVLLVLDARMNLLGGVRSVAATVLYPVQMAALMPREALSNMGGYFSSVSTLQREVQALKEQQLQQATLLQQAQLQMAENAQLRRLMEGKAQLPVQSQMAEILYDARDPSTRRVVIDRGSRAGVTLGLPVIDNAGVVGQVTRVFPFTSEVTLLTDKDQAIPVQVLRSGLRSIVYGRGHSGLLDLRFVAQDADIQVGDVLVTSGLDGMYPAGLAVARVTQVEKAAGSFGRVVGQPLAGIDRNRQVLVIMSHNALPERPQPAQAHEGSRRKLPKMEPVPQPPLPAAPLPAAGTPAAAAQAAGAPAAGAPAAGAPAATTNTAPGAAQATAPAARQATTPAAAAAPNGVNPNVR
ncbi:rod shape-determining protein MreC [Massilia sp. YIM B02443]|uniref:rod shape-determining protein MreC n=1 Tax=Massilia sp. YIM B02443 TaxID=3050127 RepID=UPI0025B70D5F|nr:rod shape-determining protein MreC [Massilia sp. YIM B02443]MDN4037436.1 rod shape-determining protein MreC [Massilia sp. YIM B02443]